MACEFELLDPTSDDLSRSFLATLCDGIEGMDRAVIINSLEILYKICQKESNEDHINKCLDLKFYQTICLFLSLNDIMLLIYTLEAIYALTSMGTRSCHLIMQVRGIIDQLVALITVEAQSYGPDGCILMRVVETVPGNMLPMVAQNIANLQNVAVIQKQQNHVQLQSVTNTDNSPLQLATKVDVLQVQPQQHQGSTSTPSITSHEDEQYALSWLGATFERANSVDSRVEQQELYRMYLSHCQKSGKHSVVTHLQFPRLVRLIYTNNVGPTTVKGNDGNDLLGFYYVAIRLRAQPLPVQGKINSQTPNKSVENKQGGKIETMSVRKLKKRPKLQMEPQQQQLVPQGQSENVVTPKIVKQDTNEVSISGIINSTTSSVQPLPATTAVTTQVSASEVSSTTSTHNNMIVNTTEAAKSPPVEQVAQMTEVNNTTEMCTEKQTIVTEDMSTCK